MGFLGFLSKGKKGEALPEERFREMIYFAEERAFQTHFTELSGKNLLEIAPRLASMQVLLRDKGGGLVARVGGPREKEGANLVASLENLPFLDGSWEVILLRVARTQAGLGRLIKESGRVLKKEGVLLLSDLHPFSTVVQSEHFKSAVGEESLGPGLERYFKFFREGGVVMESVREIFFDGSLKKFFASDSEKKAFETIRRTPFLIFFSLRKVGP